MQGTAIVCREALDPEDSALGQARRLYESTQAAPERIPWAWIAQAVAGRSSWRPGYWAAHLLLATARSGEDEDGPVVGFVYGIHVPGYGGYSTYPGRCPGYRRHGAGSRPRQPLTPGGPVG